MNLYLCLEMYFLLIIIYNLYLNWIKKDDNNMAEYVKILINTDVTKDDVYRELKDGM